MIYFPILAPVVFTASMAILISVLAGRVGLILYIKNVLIGWDQLGNAMLGGDPDETMSKAFGQTVDSDCRPCRYAARFMCWWLDKIDRRHCNKSAGRDPTEGARSIWKRHWK